MRILVTGGDGAMGKALRAYLPDALYLGHDQLDVTDPDSVWRAIFDNAPNVVIHAAAITDHQCPDIGKLINANVIGTQYVARACAPASKLVYLSTHYVYPGETGNYRETDECKPIGTYAWTKYAGEKIVLSSCQNHLIVRGSWYDYESRIKHWEKNGALVDAWCNRERIPVAAEKIAKLVNGGAWGVYNIGGKRRTFAQIASDEGHPARAIYRADLKLSYDFPVDHSVNTAKYDGLGL